jgi:hypothetical protein
VTFISNITVHSQAPSVGTCHLSYISNLFQFAIADFPSIPYVKASIISFILQFQIQSTVTYAIMCIYLMRIYHRKNDEWVKVV